MAAAKALEELLIQTRPVGPSTKVKIQSIDERVQYLYSVEEYSKAMELVRKGETSRILEFERGDADLFPKKRGTMIEPSLWTQMGEEIIPNTIGEQEVHNAIKVAQTRSAAGASGISFDHLKKVARKGGFIEKFANFCNALLKEPKLVKELKSLYTVRVVLIQKDDGGKRPIQIEETLLRLFHKIILNQISAPIMKKISEAQVANRPDQFLLAVSRLDQMLTGGNKSLMKVDLKNAFNSIPFEIVELGLKRVRLNRDYIDYIMMMLKNRHPTVNVSLETGVPQGDPLSMLLFVVGIDPILRSLQKKYGEERVVAYADDILIAKDNEDFDDRDMRWLQQEMGKHGLTVNESKCKIIKLQD